MITMQPIGYVKNQRTMVEDDNWGGVVSTIVLDNAFDPDCLQGIEAFSHAEIIFHFDQVDERKIIRGARHPRNNPDWPRVGIFAQRAKNRPNRLGSTIVRVLDCQGPALHVVGLDALDHTPVLDIKPVMQEFLPRDPVQQPAWSHELMRAYWNDE